VIRGGILILVTTCLLGRAPAVAQSSAAAEAEILFREGKRLLEEKNYQQACAKLAESYRLDPATGALLALAVCHEAEGRTASAWAELGEVVARSKREGRSDRESAAREKAAALEAKLSTLTIVVPPEDEQIASLQITRDGDEVRAAAWGAAIPLDPGEHVVEASAPGRKPWRGGVSLGAQSDRQTVKVPVLAALPAVPVLPSVASTRERPAIAAPPPASPTGLQGPATAITQAAPPIYRRSTGSKVLLGAGGAVLAVGLASLAVGGYDAVVALRKKKEYESDPNCVYDCQALDEANVDARVATKFIVAGSISTAAAIVLFLVAPAAKPAPISLAAGPSLRADAWQIGMSGRF
jgi:hypothetical protein